MESDSKPFVMDNGLAVDRGVYVVAKTALSLKELERKGLAGTGISIDEPAMAAIVKEAESRGYSAPSQEEVNAAVATLSEA